MHRHENVLPLHGTAAVTALHNIYCMPWLALARSTQQKAVKSAVVQSGHTRVSSSSSHALLNMSQARHAVCVLLGENQEQMHKANQVGDFSKSCRDTQ